MAEEILYSQEVDEDTLNDIAKDLGNTDFSYFTNGTEYAVDKLNEITSSLVTKGVLISEDKCAPTYSNGKIYIAKGTIVFGNGAKIKNSSKLSISAYSGKATCIYAYYQSTKNRAVLKRSESEPADSDYIVKLAVVSADGIITDLRPFCKAKCNLNVANQTETVTSPTFTVSNETDGTVVATIPLDFSGYNALYVNLVSGSGASSEYQSGFLALPDSEESKKFYVSNYRYITFKKSALGIDIYGYTRESPDAGSSFSVNITLY